MKSVILSLFLSVSLLACTNYGKKVKTGDVEVYYKDGVTEEQAKKISVLFNDAVQRTNPGSSGRKSFQATKPSDSVLLKMVVDKSKLGMVGDESFYAIAELVSDSVFNGGPVNLILTDDQFKPLRTLAFKKAELPKFGEKTTSGNIEVYASDEIGAKTAKDLASFLDNFLHPASAISFQVSKNENNDFVIKMVSDKNKVKTVTDQMLNEISTKISNEVLSGSPLLFQMTDEKLNPLKTFAYPTDAAQPDSTSGNQ